MMISIKLFDGRYNRYVIDDMTTILRLNFV